MKKKSARAVLVTEDSEGSESEHETGPDGLYAKAREGKMRCPDYLTSIMKKVLGAGGGKMKQLDGWIASALMAAVFVGQMVILAKHVWKISSLLVADGQVHAAHASRAGNDVTYCLAVLLVCLVWHTLSFTNDTIKAIWTAEASIIGNVMTGGFFPRPAAASMGLLLFVQKNMLATEVVTGDKVRGFESCVANSQEIDSYPAKQWFQRTHRTMALGCRGMDDDQEWASVGVAYRYSFLTSDLSATEELLHPVIDGVVDETKFCTYSCSSFKSVSVSQLVMSIGKIFAGAAVVTKFCDFATTRVGWSLLTKGSDAADLVWATLGVPLPDAVDLARAAKDHKFRDKLVSQLQGVHPRQPGSPLMCALQLMFIWWVTSLFTPTITIDGFFTVDYYTTLLMFTAALVAITLRLWSPYTCRSVVYTRNLWTEGKDSFWEFNPHHKAFEQKEIDLYDWMHVPAGLRAKYLLHMCRSIGTGEMAKLYNKKGFIPDLEEEDKKGDAETDHNTTVTDCICGVLFKAITFVRYIFCPWRLCHDDKEAESDNKERTKVTTVAEIHMDWEFEIWKTVDETPICDTSFYRIVIADSITGEVTKLSKTAGEIMVFFPQQEHERPVAFYLDEDDIVHRGPDLNRPGFSKITNMPVPRNHKDGWEFSMPMGALQENSDEWKFTRKLLGEEALKNQLGN